MKRFIRVFVVTLILSCTAFSFVFAGDGSVSVNVPYSEPSTGDTTGYLTVYTDDGRTYTYTWSFYGATKSTAFTQGGLTVGVVDGGDKLLIRMVEMNAENTVYGTLIRYGGGGVDILHSGIIDVTQSVTVNPTGNVTHYYTSGYIGSLSSDFDNFGRLDVKWGNTDYSSQLSSILSRLNSIRDTLSLTYSEIEIISTQLSNYIDDFSTLVSIVENQAAYVELIHDYNDLINTKLFNILSILEEFRDQNTSESTDSLPSDSVTDLEDEQTSLRDDSDVSTDLDSISSSFDFSDFSAAFLVVWSLCESILMTHSVLMSLLFLVLSLGIINLILSRR